VGEGVNGGKEDEKVQRKNGETRGEIRDIKGVFFTVYKPL